MKDNKKLIVLGIIFGLIIVIVLVVVLLTQSEENNFSNSNNSNPSNENSTSSPSAYLIVDEDVWRYRNHTWQKVRSHPFNDPLTVYVNGKYIGNCYLTYINAWNLLDENKKYVSYEGDLLAFTNLNINLRQYNLTTIDNNDISEINNILKNNINSNNLTINEKLVIDLDNNGINDKIINVSNLEEEDANYYFNLIYLNLNGELKIIKNDSVNFEDVLITPVYNLMYILNINNDIYDSLIFRESDSQTKSYIMYQYKGNNYQKSL